MVSSTLIRIRELDTSLIIYTDGSASNGTMNGGAGVIVTHHGDADNFVTLQTLTVKGAALTSSYEEEISAIYRALTWIRDECLDEKVLICTDSLSLCQALDAQNADVDHLTLLAHECNADVIIQ